MGKTYRVRYQLHSGHFSFIDVSGDDITPNRARLKAIDYLDANGRLYKQVSDVYLVENEKQK